MLFVIIWILIGNLIFLGGSYYYVGEIKIRDLGFSLVFGSMGGFIWILIALICLYDNHADLTVIKRKGHKK